MFQSAVTKLTAWYVGVLFVVCLVFSIPTYKIAVTRLEHGALRQGEIIQRLPGAFTQPYALDIQTARDQQLRDDRAQLIRILVLSNLAVLAIGSYVSYLFAKRTLQPIEEAHAAQSRFTTDASHELRTPLATMQAEIEVALRDKKLSIKEAREVLESNLEELARLRTLSNQLLELTRLDNSSLGLKSLDFSQLIANGSSKLEKQYGLNITSDIAKGVTVRGDEALLQQLLNIIVDNAVRYAGDKSAEISISLTQEVDKVLLRIADKGIGIKATELPHIFDRFYRGSSATRHSAVGHGLGLALAREIVQHHSGQIHAESTPNKGATFSIQLPIATNVPDLAHA